MVQMTCSFKHWITKYHKGLYVPLTFGHIELLTDELQKEYVEWCQTDEGSSYLQGGANYTEVTV